MDLKPLAKLVKSWRNRRARLRKEAQDLNKNKQSKANVYHSNIAHGKFQEVEKCASELSRVLNRMVKDGVVQEGTAHYSNEQKPKYINRCILYCRSHIDYKHDGSRIIPSYCIRLKRSVMAEHNNYEHPEDCPNNQIRQIVGLEKI